MLAKYRDVANDEQKVWDFREEQPDCVGLARLCVLSEYAGIDAPGMKANSLVVGYDADGLPQKSIEFRQWKNARVSNII